MRTRLPALALALAVPASLALTGAPAAAQPDQHPLSWHPVPVDTTQGLRGLDAVSHKTAWVSGSAGGVWRTTNGGADWVDVSPDGAEGLAFRDIEAHSARHASVLSIGNGPDSRIYTTSDGGQTWHLAFVNDDPAAFYDCMDFFPGGRRGLAMSDPVDGKFRVLATDDGGRSWDVVPADGMPPAVDGEFGFAASGTCLVTEGPRDAWIASGGAASRIFHSRDRGLTWEVTEAPIPAGPTAGVYGLAFRNRHEGVAVGGDFTVPANGVDASGRTGDGATWQSGGDLGGYRSGVDWVSRHSDTLIAVGPTGSDVSTDAGSTWSTFDTVGYDSVVCTRQRLCWASGPGGRVATMGTSRH